MIVKVPALWTDDRVAVYVKPCSDFPEFVEGYVRKDGIGVIDEMYLYGDNVREAKPSWRNHFFSLWREDFVDEWLKMVVFTRYVISLNPVLKDYYLIRTDDSRLILLKRSTNGPMIALLQILQLEGHGTIASYSMARLAYAYKSEIESPVDLLRRIAHSAIFLEALKMLGLIHAVPLRSIKNGDPIQLPSLKGSLRVLDRTGKWISVDDLDFENGQKYITYEKLSWNGYFKYGIYVGKYVLYDPLIGSFMPIHADREVWSNTIISNPLSVRGVRYEDDMLEVLSGCRDRLPSISLWTIQSAEASNHDDSYVMYAKTRLEFTYATLSMLGVVEFGDYVDPTLQDIILRTAYKRTQDTYRIRDEFYSMFQSRQRVG